MNTAELKEILDRHNVPLDETARVIAFHKGRDRELEAVLLDLDGARADADALHHEADRRRTEPSDRERDLETRLAEAEKRAKIAQEGVRRLVKQSRAADAASAAALEDARVSFDAAARARDGLATEVATLRARNATLEADHAALAETVDETYRAHLEREAALVRDATEQAEIAATRIGDLEGWQRRACEALLGLLSDSARARDAARDPAKALLAEVSGG